MGTGPPPLQMAADGLVHKLYMVMTRFGRDLWGFEF